MVPCVIKTKTHTASMGPADCFALFAITSPTISTPSTTLFHTRIHTHTHLLPLAVFCSFRGRLILLSNTHFPLLISLYHLCHLLSYHSTLPLLSVFPLFLLILSPLSGVTLPSQIRFVHYFQEYMSMHGDLSRLPPDMTIDSPAVFVTQLRLLTIPPALRNT